MHDAGLCYKCPNDADKAVFHDGIFIHEGCLMHRLRRYFLIAVLTLFVWTAFFSLAAAAPKKKQQNTAKETITYVVQKGDSVGKIAQKFSVKADDIARWNNLADVAHIRIGQKLRIRVPKNSAAAASAKSGAAPAVVQNVSYVVKKGDNLGKIARKTGVSIEDLKKNNSFLRKNPDKLKVGQTLVLRVQRFEGATGVSRGLANNGALVGGIQLKDGPGYAVRHPKNSYGTALTVSLIMDAMAAYAKKYPKAAKFAIGDLSAQHGGKLPPHLSHQSGRDVDISYINKAQKNFVGFSNMNADNLDVEKNWYVLEYFLKTKKVQYIFVDYNLQKYFYDYAKAHGYSDAQLKNIIQYPNGKKSYFAIIRHSNGHVNHFHVRFVCAPTDKDCK